MRTPPEAAISAAAAKASPPVAITGLYFAGVHISDWVMVATFIYVVLQAFFLVRNNLSIQRRATDNPDAGEEREPGRGLTRLFFRVKNRLSKKRRETARHDTCKKCEHGRER